MVTNGYFSLTPPKYLDKIEISTHKEDTMETIKNFLSDMFGKNATSITKFQREWEKARSDASNYGPSHVAEIDAIFSRYA